MVAVYNPKKYDDCTKKEVVRLEAQKQKLNRPDTPPEAEDQLIPSFGLYLLNDQRLIASRIQLFRSDSFSM